MLNFKPIEDFTFDDCVNSIERLTAQGQAIDDELQERHDHLLSVLIQKEKRAYSSCVTIADYDRFIGEYSNLTDATKYRPMYLDKAKDVRDGLKYLAKIKRRKKIIWSIVAMVCVLVALFFIGYKPITYFSASSYSVTIPKNGDAVCIKVSTDAPRIETSENIFWAEISEQGDSITITADRNYDDSRNDSIEIDAYPTFFGERIDFLKQTITINVTQEDGHASYLNVSSEYVSFAPDGGSRDISVSTDGNEWHVERPSDNYWLHIYTHSGYFTISASKNTTTSSRSAYIRVYSDNQEKTIYVSQSRYSKDAEITDVRTRDVSGRNDVPFYVDYYTQGYDESLYLCIKMVNENTNQVWYRDYARISGHMSKYESGHTFYIGPSYWHNKLGDNTVYICISRHSDGSSPICSYSDTYTITRSR